nr:MAG TPA_asm: hypothetical protein [Caudoviricetes sp.]
MPSLILFTSYSEICQTRQFIVILFFCCFCISVHHLINFPKFTGCAVPKFII